MLSLERQEKQENERGQKGRIAKESTREAREARRERPVHIGHTHTHTHTHTHITIRMRQGRCREGWSQAPRNLHTAPGSTRQHQTASDSIGQRGRTCEKRTERGWSPGPRKLGRRDTTHDTWESESVQIRFSIWNDLPIKRTS
jgi:hypothetical protein